MVVSASFQHIGQLVKGMGSKLKINRKFIRHLVNMSKSDHIHRTSHNKRNEVISKAEVVQIEDKSRTVKMLGLHISDEKFTFKAGQWVDMFIPGVETIGGFSMCSSPDALTSTRRLALVIKYAKHPPAFWVHTKCKVGDHVMLRVGGDFYYDPPSTDALKSNLLLIAGGVGINPLYSILSHFVCLHPGHKSTAGGGHTEKDSRVSMLYSAQTMEELIFWEDLTKISQDHGNVFLKMHCTRETGDVPNSISSARITSEDVNNALKPLDKAKTDVFICGPSTFISDMETFCISSGTRKDQINFEKWW